MNLQLPLTKKWFEMTELGIKPEDYREINDYWCRRFLLLKYDLEPLVWNELIEDLANTNRKYRDIEDCMLEFGVRFKNFDFNIMTLGYPKSTDKSRILKLEHAGIEIRTGNPDWGAEPEKLYFVIKHGKIIL